MAMKRLRCYACSVKRRDSSEKLPGRPTTESPRAQTEQSELRTPAIDLQLPRTLPRSWAWRLARACNGVPTAPVQCNAYLARRGSSLLGGAPISAAACERAAV
eukprot:COSAG03_NODE_63_length_15223_cov_32.095940_9_plen_103_part_00